MSLDVEVMEAGQTAAAAVQIELADRLRGSTVPILFITPVGSPIPATASEATAAVIGDAASVVTIGVGHFPWLLERGAVSTAVDDFVGRRRRVVDGT
jgi:pimeloyl-ACP methyl ester carboxylesterase